MLEREGYIKEYTVIPELGKMGYEIIAVSFLAFSKTTPDLVEKARQCCEKESCIIYAAGGEGLGMHSVMVSAHRNYSGFSRLITQLREDWHPNLKEVQSFLIGVDRRELIYKPFSFRNCEPIEE